MGGAGERTDLVGDSLTLLVALTLDKGGRYPRVVIDERAGKHFLSECADNNEFHIVALRRCNKVMTDLE